MSVLEPRVPGTVGLPPMRNLGSLYFLIRHTFVCGTLCPAIKLYYLLPETKFDTQKCNTCRVLEIRRRALEVTLGSSADANLGHNHIKV